MHVLLIGPTPEALRHTLTQLDALGVQSRVALDPRIDALRELVHGVDLVIADAQIACADGAAVLHGLVLAAHPRWLPVIVLESQDAAPLRAAAIAAGADSYFDRDVTLDLIAARLKYYRRLLDMQRVADERAKRLQRYYQQQENEQDVARGLLERLVNTEKLNDPALQHVVIPASTFSGDVVAAARTPAGVLHVLLADGTGHGLAAALNVLPVAAPFYRMSERGFSIDAIAREMNAKVREILPVERFVAATLVAVDSRRHTVQVWSGGNPQPVLIDAAGSVRKPFTLRHLPLGICDDIDFDPAVDTVHVESGERVLVYSDGAVEAESPQGVPFGAQGFEQALGAWQGGDCFVHLVHALNRHLDLRPAADDVSIALIECDAVSHGHADTPLSVVPEPPPAEVAPQHGWRVALRLGPGELRSVDAVPLIVGLVRQFTPDLARSSELFLTLSELFANALDYGLLGLDPARKHAPEGARRFLVERTARLGALEHGAIEIEVAQSADGEELLVRCKDSGAGFDLDELDARPQHGGLARVRRMARALVCRGSEVTAHLPLAAPQADALPRSRVG